MNLQEIVYDGLSLAVSERKNVSTFSFVVSRGSQLYPISAIALFVCLGWVASIILEAIVKDIQSYPTKNLLLSHISNHFQSVVKWKRMHVLVCEFLQHIDGCFGLVLLIFIAKQFMCIINDTYVTIIAFQTTKHLSVVNVVPMLAMIKHFFFLYMVTYVSEKIRKQVLPHYR